MATFNLRRFSDPDALKRISPRHLLDFLASHREYFTSRGVELPTTVINGSLDYDGIIRVLMTHGPDTPIPLLEKLYRVHEMASDESANELLDDLRDRGISLDGDSELTSVDIAIRAWLLDKDLLERRHAEQFLTRPRSFEYYQADRTPPPNFQLPSDQMIQALTEDLDDWFDEKKRGRDSKVFVFDREDSVWFLVRHGELFRREGGMNGGVFFRPEKHDVIVYNQKTNGLRMNAASKGEKELYRKTFGNHFFGDEDFFKGANKFTLKPLKQYGVEALVCEDVDGLEWVKLREIRYFRGGPYREVEIHKADDIFAAFATRGRSIPPKAHIVYAGFEVKFTEESVPRKMSLRPSKAGDRADFTRDDDSGPIIEEFLTKREFIVSQNDEEDDREEAGEVLASA